jgi:hypothetical protein
MNDKFIDIDLRLLTLRHGRQEVLAALARLVEQTPEQIEQQLRALREKSAVSRKREAKQSLVEIAALESRDRTEIAEPLRALAVAFENRSFLPNLRDVERFFHRAGESSHKLKSRVLAGPMVIRALSKLPKEELADLALRGASGNESDYALLSRAIMGVPPDDRQN